MRDVRSRGSRSMWRLSAAGWRQWFVDACAWVVSLVVATILRYDFDVSRVDLLGLSLVILVVIAVHLVVGMIGWLFQGRYWPGSLEEFRSLGWVMAVETAGLGSASVLVAGVIGLPRSVVLLAAPMAFCLMLSVRYIRRLVHDRPRASAGAGGRRTLVFGAGALGKIVVERMVIDARSPYHVVGFLDDNPAKANLSVRDVRVLGRLEDLAEVAQRASASALIVAIADVGPKLMSQVMALASPLNIEVKVVPTLDSSLGGPVSIGPVRDISVEDLIERPALNLDLTSIADYLSGKRVLVTGAGGSIGRELCVQINRHHPSALVMLDHDETHLQKTEFAVWGTGLLTRPELVLADIRDRDRLRQVFAQWHPDVVFHAAALKHVPMLQRYPQEAWDTNVIGTLNVLECSRAVGTSVFVNISTDKAADPTTILGHTKRLAECLTSGMAQQTGNRYCSVRFGNVFGSRGSVVPLFQKMIDRGLPITLTHQKATRYFMSIREACQLVISAGATGRGGEVMILDMGSPVRIMDIVTRLMEISGKTSPIQVSGLRDGEKIHEVLLSAEELAGSVNPAELMVSAPVPPMSTAALDYDAWLSTVTSGLPDESRPAASHDELELDVRV